MTSTVSNNNCLWDSELLKMCPCFPASMLKHHKVNVKIILAVYSHILLLFHTTINQRVFDTYKDKQAGTRWFQER